MFASERFATSLVNCDPVVKTLLPVTVASVLILETVSAAIPATFPIVFPTTFAVVPTVSAAKSAYYQQY